MKRVYQVRNNRAVFGLSVESNRNCFGFALIQNQQNVRSLSVKNARDTNLRSGVIFSEERESIATRESAVKKGEKKERLIQLLH